MIRKILLATDGSEKSERTEQVALELAKPLGAEVVVLCAYEAPSGFRRRGAGLIQELLLSLQEDVKDILDEVTQKVAAQGMKVSALAIEGSQAEAVLRAIEETHPDLVVIGAGSKSGLPGMLLGSVAAIVHHSPVPVVVV